MKYYNLIINLFKPLTEDKPNASDHAAFVNEVRQTPEEAVSSAAVRLETLFHIYYLRHGFEAMDAYLPHFLNSLGFMSMEDLRTNKESPLVDIEGVSF